MTARDESRSAPESRVVEVGHPWKPREHDYLARTIQTVRNHRGADNCWPQWANIFADEIERCWKLLDALTTKAACGPLTPKPSDPCLCRVECMDADGEEGTCKGLPLPPKEPLVEIVLVRRDALSEGQP